MQRLKNERGAVGVMLALLMVPLIGFAAIAVDVAAMGAERQQLQTGADAAALAIAQDCARNNCLTPASTAQTLAVANSNDGQATATVVAPTPVPSSGQVTVQNAGVREHWFAPVLGVDESDITTRATAAWGYPSGGIAMLPLIFSLCEFNAQTGGGLPSSTTQHTILFPKTSDAGCTNQSGNFVPGGFGWIKTIAQTCTAASSISPQTPSEPGNTPPSTCDPTDLTDLRGETVLLPIFDLHGGTGNYAWYRVYGYAAFKITGYHFGGQYTWNQPCTGSDRCVRGYFTEFVDLADAFDYSLTAPNLGAAVVSLIK